jgi:hypothetical protein
MKLEEKPRLAKTVILDVPAIAEDDGHGVPFPKVSGDIVNRI